MKNALTYPQIQEATKAGPEAVAALLHGAGVELAQLPKELRQKLRGEAPEAPAASLGEAPAKDPPVPTHGRREAGSSGPR